MKAGDSPRRKRKGCGEGPEESRIDGCMNKKRMRRMKE